MLMKLSMIPISFFLQEKSLSLFSSFSRFHSDSDVSIPVDPVAWFAGLEREVAGGRVGAARFERRKT